jgi:hypothetical protein
MEHQSSQSCESCGMPIEGGQYCAHCVDETGHLQPFEVRFEKMVAWVLKSSPHMPRAQAELTTKAHMRTLPAWKDHPALA